ncbi:MAG TPA: hypothetical protein VNZ22_13075, partial [Bacillota bacterium]|nr:hypothetical protein [Bacillota bacterium]
MGSIRVEKEELYPAKLVPAVVAVAWEGYQAGRKALVVGRDKFPVYEEDPQREIHLLLNSFLSAAANRNAYKLDPAKLPAGRKLLDGDARWRGRVVMAATARTVWFWKVAPQWDKDWKAWVYEDKGEREPLHPLLATLFGMELELTEEEVIDLARLLSGPQGEDIAEYLPPLGVVLAIERVFAGNPNLKRFQKELLALLQALLASASTKESAAENRRGWGSLGATEAVMQMDDPNAACLHLGKLLLNDAVLTILLRELEFDSWYMGPLSTLLDLLELHLASHPLSAEIRSRLVRIQKQLEGYRLHKAQQRELGRIRALLGEASTEEIEPGEAWANQARQDFAALDPSSRAAWNRLVAHCLTAETSKPAKKWLTTANELVAAIGQQAFKQALLKWFPLVALPRPIHRAPRHATWTPDPDLLITERNALILKGLA